MKYEVPEYWGWRCSGNHKHPNGEKCPNDHTPHPERPYIFTKHLFDSEAEAEEFEESIRLQP